MTGSKHATIGLFGRLVAIVALVSPLLATAASGTVAVVADPAVQGGDLVIWATNAVKLEPGTSIASDGTGNDIVTTNAWGGADVPVRMRGDATTDGQIRVIGERINLDSAAVIAGDAFYTLLQGSGTVGGAQHSPLAVPVPIADAPAFRTGTPSNAKVTVNKNRTRTITPGTYGDIVVKRGGTLILDGAGDYIVKSITLERFATVEIDAADNVEVLVKNQFMASPDVSFGPADAAAIAANNIVVYVEGADEATTTPGRVGSRNTFEGTMYVRMDGPRLTVGKDAEITGALFGSRVKVDQNTVVTAASFFGGADLSITKSDGVDPVIAGTQLTYTIDVSNAGPQDAMNVVVTDTLPAGVAFSSSSGCAEDPNGVPTCSLGTIANGGSASYLVTVDVASSVVGTIFNGASVVSSRFDPNVANNSVIESTVVVAEADLSISKSDGVDPVVAGTQLTYTIDVANAGPSVATGVVVADTLPAGVSFVSSSGCAEDPNGVPTCSLGTIASGGSASYMVTVDVGSATLGTVTNSASVSSAATDPDTANNSVSEDTSVVAEADLSISKSDGVDPVVAGTQLTYTIDVANAGPSVATGVVVADTLPAGVSFVSSTGCAEDPNGAPTCSLGTIASGGSASYMVTVDVGSATLGTVTNSASVSSAATDPDTANNSVSEDTSVVAEADLSITKSDDPASVVAGSSLTYTIDVANAGPSVATNVVVTDTLPAGVSFVSSAGCAEDPNGAPTCSLGSIASGGSASYMVTVSVDGGTVGTITNLASVTSDTTDPDTANNSVSEDTTVTAQADLSITKTDDVDPQLPGGTVTYVIDVANAGPSVATNVVVTDTLPAGATFVSSTGCAEDPNGAPTCSLGSIASGGSASYSVSVQIPVGAFGTLTNSVSVTSDAADLNTANNSATEQTTIAYQNDAPSFTKGADELVLEDAGLQTVAGWASAISAGPPDEAGQVLTFLVLNDNNGLFSSQPSVSSTGELSYTGAADANGSATVSVALMDDGGTANGGVDTSAVQNVTITVTSVNDEPGFVKGADQTVASDAGAQTVDPWATAISAGPLDEAGQALTFSITGNTNPSLFSVTPAVGPTGVLTFTPDAAAAGGTATVTIELVDDGGTANGGDDTSSSQTFTITVFVDAAPAVASTSPVADATSVAADANIVITFDEAVTVAGDWVTVACGAALFNPTGSGGATVLAVTDADPIFTLNPAADLPGGESCTVTVHAAQVTDDDVSDPPDNMAADHQFSFGISPVANADSYGSLGNVGIVPAAADGLILGAGADDGTALLVDEVQGNGANVGAATMTSSGGSVTVAADGGFDYTPSAGFAGADTFTYRVSGPTGASNTATVTITVGPRVWFIDSATAAAGNAGTLANPYTTLGAFDAANGGAGLAPGANDIVFVATGSGDYTGGVALEAGQRLIGEGATASIASIGGFMMPAYSKALPATGGTRPVLANSSPLDVAINLGSGNVVRGLDVVNVTGPAGIAGNSVGTVSISEVGISSTNGSAISINAGVLEVSLDSVQVTNSSAGGVNLTNAAAGSAIVLSDVAITSFNGAGINISGAGSLNVSGATNSVSSTNGPAVTISGMTLGAATFQSVSSSGSTLGISLTNTGAGTFTVTGTGAAGSGGTLSNIAGDGVRLQNTGGLVTLDDMSFTDIGSTTGAFHTRSGHDAIHGQDVFGGLAIDNATVDNISDNFINGAAFVDGLSPTAFVGLSITNSAISDTNRFHVANVADSSGEGAVRIVGLSGTVVITDNTFLRGAEFLDLFTASSGTLGFTVSNNSFTDGYKEFTSGGTGSVGKNCVDLTTRGSTTNTVTITNNQFVNCNTASMRIISESGAVTGNTSATVTGNSFRVTDHSSTLGLAGNFPQGGALLRQLGSGQFDAVVENNTFGSWNGAATSDWVMNADGGVGALTIIAEGGTNQVEVTGNAFNSPINSPFFVRADGAGTDAEVFFHNNIWRSQFALFSPDPFFGSFTGPGLAHVAQAQNSATLDLVLENEAFGVHDETFDFQDTIQVRAQTGSTVCASFTTVTTALAGGNGDIHTNNSSGTLNRHDGGGNDPFQTTGVVGAVGGCTKPSGALF